MRHSYPLIVVAGASLLACPALASMRVIEQPNVLPKTAFAKKPMVTPKEPVVLEASQVDYDRENQVVLASGHVTITQGETFLIADTVIYDQAEDKVTAIGHVSMLEPSGNVYFADALEIKDQMSTGIIRAFKARLTDNSVFAAAKARRIDENKTELFKAVYTPCKIAACEGKPGAPMWQLEASDVTIDQEEEKVRYHNAFFDIYGLPVVYTPYLSHATPGAENQSGLLLPEYQQSANIGSVFKLPVYYTIAPDKDLTLIPIYTTLEGPVLAGQYRQAFDNGRMLFDGSITRPKGTTADDLAPGSDQIRGHINGKGFFTLNNNSDWGFDIHRASDETYLRRYNFSSDTLLTSKAYVETFNLVPGNDRSYASVQGVTFQGLTAQDDWKKTPIVLPLATVSYESNPGVYNSRFTLDGSALALFRHDGDESRRLSSTAGWKLPYISEDGQIIELHAQLRADVYSVNNVLLPGSANYTGVAGRAVPQADVTWRYPFMNSWENGSVMLEPIAQFVVSPSGGNSSKIPNEDSQVPEFTDSNLFSTDRYAGLDRIETGPRMNYGLRGQGQFASDHYVDWMFGQSYRVDNDINFPLTNNLVSHFSDYVGRLGLNYAPFSIAYRFRLDKDNFAPQRDEVDASLSYYPVAFSTAYLSLKNDPILANKQQFVGSVSVNVTNEVTWNSSVNKDLLLNQLAAVTTGLTYKNECVNISAMIDKEYTAIADVQPTTNFLLQISLKNLN